MAIIQYIYGLWMLIPAGVRAGFSLGFAAFVGLVLAFNWTLPANWLGVRTEITAFWAVAFPVLFGVFQKSIWPPLFAWILSLLGLEPSTDGKALLRTY